MILRKWTGRIRTADENEFCAYIGRSSGRDSSRTPGNLGLQVVTRQMDAGISEVSAFSWWESMESIKAFAGDTPEIARYYEDDGRYLLEFPRFVEHHVVVSTDLLLSSPCWRGDPQKQKTA